MWSLVRKCILIMPALYTYTQWLTGWLHYEGCVARRNWAYAWSIIRVYKIVNRGPKSNTLETDSLVGYVVAQQYFSASFVSLRSHSLKEKLSALLVFVTFFLNCVSRGGGSCLCHTGYKWTITGMGTVWNFDIMPDMLLRRQNLHSLNELFEMKRHCRFSQFCERV